MFAIGDFSKITGLTVKTLRFVHAKDLLEATIEHHRDVVRSLDAFLNDQEEVGRIMARTSFEVEEKVVRAMI